MAHLGHPNNAGRAKTWERALQKGSARPTPVTITETMDTYGHLFPDAEDLGRGAIDAVFAAALTEQGRNQDAS